MNETGSAARSSTERGAPSLLARHVLGIAVLLLTIVPAYLGSQADTQALRGASETDDGTDAVVSGSLAMEIEAHIREVAVHYDISPLLVAAIVEAESEFNPRAVSRRGARGLMQLMPRTATSLDVQDTFDPYENIEGGVRHLRRLMDRFNGNLPVVLAAYNAGEQTVVAYGGVPPYPETRRYVARILRRIGRRDLAAGVSVSARPVVIQADWRERQALERQAWAAGDRNEVAPEWTAATASRTDRAGAQGP